jgi:hypothetical protein
MEEEQLNSLLAQVPYHLRYEVAECYEAGFPRVDQEYLESKQEDVLAGIQRLSESVAKGHCNYEQLRDIDRLLYTANEMSNIEQYSIAHRFIYGSVLVDDVKASIAYMPLAALPFNDTLYYFTSEDIKRFDEAKSNLSAASQSLFNIRPIKLIAPEDIEPQDNQI